MNDLYAKAREELLRAGWSWEADDFTVAYLDATYTVDIDNDEFATAIAGALIDTAPLAGMAILDGGIADADDVTSIVVPIGATVAAVVIYQDTGVAGTSRLIAYYDEAEDYTPIGRPGTGAAIPCLWSSSEARVFAI